jgi:hypothetical protein
LPARKPHSFVQALAPPLLQHGKLLHPDIASELKPSDARHPCPALFIARQQRLRAFGGLMGYVDEPLERLQYTDEEGTG